MGDYVLTVDDLRAGREFDDAVARGVFYLDGHKPDDDKRTYILSKEEMQVPRIKSPTGASWSATAKTSWRRAAASRPTNWPSPPPG